MPLTDSGSDGENGERPIRERLKQTTIAKTNADGTVVSSEHIDTEMDAFGSGGIEKAGETTTEGSSQLPGRKRYLEDIGATDSTQDTGDTPATPSSGGHLRKRYREVQGEADENKDTHDSKGGEVQDTIPSEDKGSGVNATDSSADMHTPPPEKHSDIQTQVLSPTKKRSRETLEGDDKDQKNDRNQKIPATEETRARRSSEEERETDTNDDKSSDVADSQNLQNGIVIAPKESIQSGSKPLPVSSGFANTSSVSPFGALSGSKSPKDSASSTDPPPATSKSAFAASGFASMSDSASPFGTIGAAVSPQPQTASHKHPQTFGSISGTLNSGFGSGSTTTTTFGSSTSGFATLSGSAFGGASPSPFASGQKLSSFAAPVGDTKLGEKSDIKPIGAAKGFGEAKSEDEGSVSDDEGEEGEENTTFANEEEADARFKIQEDRDTGEEGEKSVFVNKAKLFQFDRQANQWKERGTGQIKLNVPDDATPTSEALANEAEIVEEKDKQPKKVPRLLMRNIATHKLILNAKVFKGMNVKEQGSKSITFLVPVDGGLVTHLLRMSKEPDVKELMKTVEDIQKDL